MSSAFNAADSGMFHLIGDRCTRLWSSKHLKNLSLVFHNCLKKALGRVCASNATGGAVLLIFSSLRVQCVFSVSSETERGLKRPQKHISATDHDTEDEALLPFNRRLQKKDCFMPSQRRAWHRFLFLVKILNSSLTLCS